MSAKPARRAKANPLRDLPLAKVYQTIEPGPVVLLATAEGGRANVMAMSWHMMVDFEPPLIACIVRGGLQLRRFVRDARMRDRNSRGRDR